MIHFICNFHKKFKLLTSNYKINNHRINEIKHDHLKFIAAKGKIIHSKNKAFPAKKNYWLQKQIAHGKNQSSSQKFLVKGRPSMWCITVRYVHGVNFRISFCLPLTVIL